MEALVTALPGLIVIVLLALWATMTFLLPVVVWMLFYTVQRIETDIHALREALAPPEPEKTRPAPAMPAKPRQPTPQGRKAEPPLPANPYAPGR